MEALRYQKVLQSICTLVLPCLQVAGRNPSAFVILLLLPIGRVRLRKWIKVYWQSRSIKHRTTATMVLVLNKPKDQSISKYKTTFVHSYAHHDHDAASIYIFLPIPIRHTMACTACWIWGSAVLGQNLHLANMWIVVETNRVTGIYNYT